MDNRTIEKRGSQMRIDINTIIEGMADMTTEEKISYINALKWNLHINSPFKDEPVDCVLWVKNEQVAANDYNPNRVAPPEMELLYLSIKEDGYTQPIVTMQEGDQYVVVDGFHRHRIGKEKEDIRNKINGYLPITLVRPEREEKDARIAATIRHNRARGKHTVEGMSNIVLELSRRNWNDKKIAKELGMEQDEVLRLKQITGLADLFSNEEFSQAWEV